MRQLFGLFAFVLLFVAASCVNEYDDSVIINRIDDLEERVKRLEELCEKINADVASLQTIVKAVEERDYITDVKPITDNRTVIGYEITFAKAGSITIYHGVDGKDGADGADGADGKDGEDGYTPSIGVRKDVDGIYYWVLDGEWLYGEDGEKIRVHGTDGEDGTDGKDGEDGTDGKDGEDGKDGADGKDGITPQLRIENEYWFISYDNGYTWIELGKATGEDGKDGADGADGADGKDGKDGDSLFSNVYEDDNNVYFELADGSAIVIPKGSALEIEFCEADLRGVYPNSTRNIGYEVKSEVEPVTVEVVASSDIKAKVVKESYDGRVGHIEICTGDVIDAYSKVVVFVSNDASVIMRTIYIEQAGLVVENGAEKSIPSEGGEITLYYLTNVECEVVIPEEAQSWVAVSPSTRAMERKQLTLDIAPNTYYDRSTVVSVLSVDGDLHLDYTLRQQGDLGVADATFLPPNNEIWYTTSDGKVLQHHVVDQVLTSETKNFGVNVISNTYQNGKGIIKCDGDIRYFADSSFSSSYTDSQRP